jgi:hypothetical protein
LGDEIADKANARGWCDCRSLPAAKGLGTGRHIYGWYSDPEIELCDAICVRCGTPGLTW